MLFPSEISVVMQGPIVGKSTASESEQLTRRCVQSVRNYLPGAELILSTWNGSDISGIEFDVLVENEDPGPVKTFAEKSVNINRQIESTRMGVRSASRNYILKLRTDTELTSASMLDYFELFLTRSEEKRIFENRVLVWEILTKAPSRSEVGCYHSSDIVCFGTANDIRLLWDVPLYTRSEEQLQADKLLVSQSRGNAVPISFQCSEQYVWLQAINKREKAFLPSHPTRKDGETSDFYLANNFVVLNEDQLGIRWKNGLRVNRSAWAETYSHAEWQQLYRKYCDPGFSAAVAWQKPAKVFVRFALTRATFISAAYRWFYYKLVPDAHGKESQPLGKVNWRRLTSWLR